MSRGGADRVVVSIEPGQEGEGPVELVRLPSHPRPFILWMSPCCKHGCGCSEVGAILEEVDEHGKAVDGGLRVVFDVDIAAWRELKEAESRHSSTGGAERTAAMQRTVDELIACAGDDVREAFRLAADESRRAAAFEMPAEDIRRRRLVPYSDMAKEDKSILSGGEECSFILERAEGAYLIEDLYCLDPSCACEEVRLVFLGPFGKSGAEPSMLEFSISLSGRGDVLLRRGAGASSSDARALLDAWLANECGVLGLLRFRYGHAKVIGRRLLGAGAAPKRLAPPEELEPSIQLFHLPDGRGGRVPAACLLSSGGEMAPLRGGAPIAVLGPGVARPRKAGRNEPCPCGSGRKYKRCCGRA